MRYIGIDIGSSFIKSALIDVDYSKVLTQDKFLTPNKEKLSDERKFEIQASNFMTIIEQVIDKYTKEYSDIAGVLLSTQMHGFIYSVKGFKDMYISWQDMRCLNMMDGKNYSHMDYLKDLLSPSDMEKSGVYFKPSLGLCNLYTLINSEDVPNNGTMYTLGSYIISKLTGNNICHIMNAAPWGIVDITKHSWDRSIIDKIGFISIELPKITEEDFKSCGTFVSNGQQLDVFPDYGDQQISILGSIPGEKDVVINIATASQVSIVTESFKTGEYEVRPYFEGHYLNTISNMPSGRNLDVLINFIGQLIKDISGLEVSSSQIWNSIHNDFKYGSNGIKVNVGFYETPMNLDGGSILGIKSGNLDLNSLFSAAFENMGQTYWDNILKLYGGTYINHIVCAGGVSWKVPELLKAIEKITGQECVLSAMPDEALSGLFRVALICSGRYKSLLDTKEQTLMLKEIN